MLRTKPIIWLPLLFVFLLSDGAWAAVAVAGKINALKGKVFATGTDGKVRKLKKGRPLFAGDKIDTKARSAIAMKFKDGTRFALGSNSSMAVDEFVYGVSAEEDTFSVKVFKGAFRFLTGLVAKKKPKSMRVQLGTTATIGIRGTNVAGELIGEAATVVLLEPEQKGASTAIEVFNDFGSVTIDEPGFGTEVPDANSPPSPIRRMKLRTIQNVMRSMQSISRSMSRPRVGGLP